MAAKSMLRYDAPWPLFTLDWCNSSGSQSVRPSTVFRLAIGSFLENYQNTLQIIGLSEQQSLTENGQYDGDYAPSTDFNVLAEVAHGYPATKLLWEPASANGNSWPFKGNRLETELLATTGDVLRIWEFDSTGNQRSGRGNSYVGRGAEAVPGTIQQRLSLTSSKGSSISAPLTSFAWNAISPSMIVTSSIDTTCTVWDINASSAITQLIAHDKDVYDVAWLPHSTDSFVSVGADGSLRAFDLRSLEHSTILYESPTGTPMVSAGAEELVPASPRTSSPPLARVVFNPTDSNYISMFHLGSSKVTIIDMRTPGRPLAELVGHQGSINAMGWGSCDGATIATAGDDCQLLVWDLQSTVNQNRAAPTDITNLPSPGEVRDPILAYTAPSEVNSLAWSFPMVGPQFGGGGIGTSPVEWIAISSGSTIRALRV